MASRRALITGASAGLGREFARQLAASGMDLVIVARRVDALNELADELIIAHEIDVIVLQADLSKPAAPSELYGEIHSRGLRVDYLINNAGASGPDLIEHGDWEASRNYVELMMTSIAAMCHFFLPAMQERGFGRILNVASVAGLITVSGDYSYGPTKAYVVALSRALSSSFRKNGVHVLALCPGFTHTEFHVSDKLTQMKEATPKFIWYDADVVVREGLAALEKGRDVFISGRLYRFLVPLLRSPFSRKLVAALGVKL